MLACISLIMEMHFFWKRGDQEQMLGNQEPRAQMMQLSGKEAKAT